MPAYSLSDEDRDWIRRRLGEFVSAFSTSDPDEIADYYNDAEGDKTKTVAYCFEGLLTGAVSLTDYSQGQSRESRSKIFDRIKYFADMWANRAGLGGGRLTSGTILLNKDEADPNA